MKQYRKHGARTDLKIICGEYWVEAINCILPAIQKRYPSLRLNSIDMYDYDVERDMYNLTISVYVDRRSVHSVHDFVQQLKTPDYECYPLGEQCSA